MKKRNLLMIMLIAVLALTLSLGTVAYYTKSFTSNDSVIKSAKFEIDSNGTLDEDVEFDLTEGPIYPGYTGEVYEFEIDKKGTEVPVKYEIQLITKEGLFEAKGEERPSPVLLGLYQKINNEWEYIGGTNKVTVIPENLVENFKIMIEWRHSDYDIEYQNATGKVGINVVATQMDGEPGDPGEEDPQDPEPTEPSVNVTYSKRNGSTYVTVNVQNIEGANNYRAAFFDTSINSWRSTNNTPIGEETIINIKGEIDLTSLRIRIYDEAKVQLHEFNDVIPTPVN